MPRVKVQKKSSRGAAVKCGRANKEKGCKMNNKTYNERMLRHGEVLCIPIAELPEGLEKIFEGKEYIIARSESHHHHVAVAERPDALTVYTPVGADSQDVYLRVSAPTKVEHKKSFDKHATFDLPEGLYLIRGKNEYDPFAKLIEKVRD